MRFWSNNLYIFLLTEEQCGRRRLYNPRTNQGAPVYINTGFRALHFWLLTPFLGRARKREWRCVTAWWLMCDCCWLAWHCMHVYIGRKARVRAHNANASAKRLQLGAVCQHSLSLSPSLFLSLSLSPCLSRSVGLILPPCSPMALARCFVSWPGLVTEAGNPVPVDNIPYFLKRSEWCWFVCLLWHDFMFDYPVLSCSDNFSKCNEPESFWHVYDITRSGGACWCWEVWQGERVKVLCAYSSSKPFVDGAGRAAGLDPAADTALHR